MGPRSNKNENSSLDKMGRLHRPRPITIFHDNLRVNEGPSETPKSILVIKVPKPFPYTLNKIVPWDYHCNYANETAATDLTSVGGITRSRHVYMPANIDKIAPEKPSTPTGKEQLLQEK